jgi:alcohol dehydrogenase class IV
LSPEPDFTFRDGERVIRFGRGALEDGPGLIEAQGLHGYVVLTTERAPKVVGGEVLQVAPGPVAAAAAQLRPQVAGRPIVAVGGGRVIDTAKAVAGADGLRCAAIPTTLSGAPLTPFHRMPEGAEGGRMVRPALVVSEPELTASQPLPGLAASAMNALAHAVEALYAPGANPVAEGAALRAATLFASALPGEPDRPDLALAALLAGWAVGTTGFAVHHATCQTLVAVAGTPHAETNAVMLPRSIAFMADRAPREIGLLGEAVGGDPATIVAELATLAGPTTLAELGVGEERLDELANAVAAHPALGNTPGGAGRDDVRLLLQSALS